MRDIRAPVLHEDLVAQVQGRAVHGAGTPALDRRALPVDLGREVAQVLLLVERQAVDDGGGGAGGRLVVPAQREGAPAIAGEAEVDEQGLAGVEVGLAERRCACRRWLGRLDVSVSVETKRNEMQIILYSFALR